MGKWGFARKLSRSKGVNALFHDHSGDGKTVPAKMIARFAIGLQFQQLSGSIA